VSAIANWRYVGADTNSRLDGLAHSRPAAELPAALRAELTVGCYHRDPGQTDASYERAVFCGTVEPTLFDWFFNARTGYRGAYYDSPEAGFRFNRTLIDNLAPALAGWAVAQHQENDVDWILRSLAAPSAKAWLAEHPGLCPACAGEWSPSYVSALHIQNGRWEHAVHTHAEWGRQAPYLTKIRIFGGLINGRSEECVASHKVDRASQIFKHGWS
jgi:hypothetical protein